MTEQATTMSCEEFLRIVAQFDEVLPHDRTHAWHHVADRTQCYSKLSQSERDMVVIQALFESQMI